MRPPHSRWEFALAPRREIPRRGWGHAHRPHSTPDQSSDGSGVAPNGPNLGHGPPQMKVFVGLQGRQPTLCACGVCRLSGVNQTQPALQGPSRGGGGAEVAEGDGSGHNSAGGRHPPAWASANKSTRSANRACAPQMVSSASATNNTNLPFSCSCCTPHPSAAIPDRHVVVAPIRARCPMTRTTGHSAAPPAESGRCLGTRPAPRRRHLAQRHRQTPSRCWGLGLGGVAVGALQGVTSDLLHRLRAVATPSCQTRVAQIASATHRAKQTQCWCSCHPSVRWCPPPSRRAATPSWGS